MGATNIEFRWTRRGPVVIEVNPRLASGESELVQLPYGIDLINEHIKLVIGDKCDLRARHFRTAAARFLVPDRDGILDRIEGTSRAAAVPGVVDVRFYVAPNTPIVRKGDDRDWIGQVIAASTGPAQTKAILQRAVDLISWPITPFPALDELGPIRELTAPAQALPDNRWNFHGCGPDDGHARCSRRREC